MENEVKEPAPKYNFISQEEYLLAEREATEKHEYFQGEVFAISGASLQHNIIFHNVYGDISHKLKGSNCKPFGSDLRIHIPLNSFYTYPDISMICGKPETPDESNDTVLNPSVIIEILSKSTKDYDRGTKFHLYRSIKTLKEYILIDSTSVSVEIYKRQLDDSWILTEFKQLSSQFVISTINLTIPLNALYEDVSFEK
ncbi:MAG: Uma2 family endonuclease [Chitinophagaceae bacterium]